MHFIKLMHILKQVIYSFVAIISFFLCLLVILPICKAHIEFYTKSTTEENVPSDDIIKTYLNPILQQIKEIAFDAFVAVVLFCILFFVLAIVLIACHLVCPDYITPIIEFLDGLGIRHRLRNHFRRHFRVRQEPRPPPELIVEFNPMRYSSDEEVERY